MAQEVESLSEFELTAWNWYRVNVSPFTMQAGIVGQMFAREAPEENGARGYWVTALNAIYETMEFIKAEQREKANR